MLRKQVEDRQLTHSLAVGAGRYSEGRGCPAEAEGKMSTWIYLKKKRESHLKTVLTMDLNEAAAVGSKTKVGKG